MGEATTGACKAINPDDGQLFGTDILAF